jgi:coenzyme PQQ synthesis protein D (PqqD)
VAVPEQVFCVLGDESVILNMKNSSYYGLNAVGASVWKLLQQRRRIAELRDAIVDEYDVEAERCERDVLELLDKLRGEGLIQVVDDICK